MQATTAPNLLPHLWKSALTSGALALILGILVLAWPQITILAAAIVFGAYLLFTGIAQVMFAFSLHIGAGGQVLLFISGAASVVLAMLCFRSLADSVLLLAIWIGVGFIFRGVATAISAISDPMLPGRGWHVVLGAISLLAGIVMLASPFESVRVLALIVGIWLVVIGAFEIVSALGVRNAAKAPAGAVSDGDEDVATKSA